MFVEHPEVVAHLNDAMQTQLRAWRCVCAETNDKTYQKVGIYLDHNSLITLVHRGITIPLKPLFTSFRSIKKIQEFIATIVFLREGSRLSYKV